MTFDITELIYRVPNFLSLDECKYLIDEYEKRSCESSTEHCPDANTGVDTYSSFQRICLIEGTESYELIFRKTEQAINQYLDYLESKQSFHIPLLRKSFNYSYMFRLLKYGVGNKIHPHTDYDPLTYGSITFNLNSDYTGGDFRFFNGKHTIKLGCGEMMIWPADYYWIHEVTPIESGNRYSTNSFLLSHSPNFKNELVGGLDVLEHQYYRMNNKSKPKSYDIKQHVQEDTFAGFQL